MTKETAVAKASTAQLPAGYDLDELAQDAKQNPKMDVGDVALPFLTILQAGSPQVNPGHGKYVEGAQASMFFNNVSMRVYEGRKEGLIIVPCYYERKLVEWIDRDTGGGGWVGDYPIDSDILQKCKPNAKGIPSLPNGHLVVETAYHYVLYLDPQRDMWSQALVAMKSTSLKKNRMLNNSIAETLIPGTELQAPRFMFPYVMTTVFEQKGDNSWWNYDFAKMEDPVEKHVYSKAKEFAALAKSGVIARNPEPDDEAAYEASKRDNANVAKEQRLEDDGIPF